MMCANAAMCIYGQENGNSRFQTPKLKIGKMRWDEIFWQLEGDQKNQGSDLIHTAAQAHIRRQNDSTTTMTRTKTRRR